MLLKKLIKTYTINNYLTKFKFHNLKLTKEAVLRILILEQF